MPLGLATSLLGFTSSVKEVRKVGFEVGHLSAHVTTNWPIVVSEAHFATLFRVDY